MSKKDSVRQLTPGRMTAQPHLHENTNEIQAYGTVLHLVPLDLEEPVRLEITGQLNRLAAKLGDDGTNDLLVSDVLRTNEMEVWFLSEHLVDVPLIATGRKSRTAV
jgi:DNA-binding ferritin-like protein